ncbi:MAG TPA: Hsp20/alpha crystallin family protein [Blastocatellia bacterium]|nr:Hsp20/alpha crystallin family protein [Blastocatellia bacterium]
MTAPLNPLPEEFSEQLRKQLRRLLVHFDEMRAQTPTPGAWMPPLDLRELDDAILVNLEVPGIPYDHLRITVMDGTLKIEGRKERPASRQAAEAEKPLRFLCLERSYGSFTRKVSLKWPIDVDGISSWLANGILYIRLPKARVCGQEIVIPITEER